jgi:prepilin-type N-terminal cleavage/methylation domain-containing protein
MKYMATKECRALNQAGDTIVEVMVVLAVLGLAFAISYATANHGLIQSRNAEEHSQALGIVDSQVELLRSAFSQQVTIAQDGTAFCMQGTAPIAGFGIGYPTAAAAADDFSKYPNSCKQNILYYESIVYDTTNNNFDFRIRWDGLGNLGRQQEEITYKISPLSLVGTTWTNPVAIISPSLSPHGGTGPGGDFYPTDTVTFSVGGTNVGDTCVIKDTAGTTYSSACSGTFPASKLPPNQTSNLIAYVTDSGTVYTSAPVSVKTINTPPIVPVLSAHGGTGPLGDFYPGDTVTIKVIGIKSGDKCVIKDNAFLPKTYLTVIATATGCSGFFSSDNLPSDRTSILIAYVTDSGTVHTSNSVSVTTVTPSCPFGYKQGTPAQYYSYGQPPPYCVPVSL